MKKILFLFFLISSSLAAQHHASALYIIHQPVDFGTGLRADYYIRNLGLYSSASYGNWGLYRQYGLKHHTKLSTGILIPLKDQDEGTFDLTVGVNYHHLGSFVPNQNELNTVILKSWSFELGLTVKLAGIAIGMRTDLLRWEPDVDFGITF